MILDYLTNAKRYESLHRRFTAGFEYLRQADLAAIADGKHTIDGDGLFAIVDRNTGRGRERSPLESHRRYVDIQYVVSGHEAIGFLSRGDCQRISTPYDPERDIEFYYDRPATWLTMEAGMFAIFYPEDAHAPLAAEGPVQKVVVKVSLE